MSTELTWQTVSTSSGATERLAETIGARLRGGEVIELASDLGGGKTTFVRGLVRGAGSSYKVASPTFTISREYQAPKFVIYHFDFYRLSEAGIMADELHEAVHDPEAVIVVEWGEVVAGVLPVDRLKITISVMDEQKRSSQFSYPAQYSYLLEDVT